ncbi:hypothetical protein ACFFS2_08330 [Streptomyces aurantiacus]|uniref:Uncharacterized protein n=1 Tax=Streptomyces aurantiacus TaxID=47760 RepID=A0A7G1PAK9_9ACTN|nr:hypothetical protein [Streptomyces aurantiacus]BCL31571.1 hypothetical protein GCM10017557_64300 [Streptomyces aurantiacus]
MTDLAKKRFAQLGQQLQLDQLTVVRRQAEGWRNGLTGLTGLVGVVFVLKGRESVAGMPTVWRWTTAALLVAAFGLLLIGALGAVRAAHGQLGQRTWLTGDRLFAAVLDEVERTQDALTAARRTSVVGLCAIVAAIGVSWVVPAEESAAGSKEPATAVPHVLVVTVDGPRCGELMAVDTRTLTLKVAGESGESGGRTPAASGWRSIPFDQVRSITPVRGC